MLQHANELPKAPSRVLLLGGHGFIGRALAGRLDDADVPVEAPASDVLDLAAGGSGEALSAILRPNDAVVMAAALTPDRGRDVATFMRNLRMTANLCVAIERQPVAHLIYLSSDAVYPFTDARVAEDTPAAPEDLYGTMHRAREVMLESLSVPLAILRPTLVFGGADTHNSYGPNRLRRMAQSEGRIKLFGGGEETRDHIYVHDIAEVIRLVLFHGSYGLVNVATGDSISFDDLARQVGALFEPPADVEHTERQNPVTHRHFDTLALRRAFPKLRFTPLAESLAAAHREMLADL